MNKYKEEYKDILYKNSIWSLDYWASTFELEARDPSFKGLESEPLFTMYREFNQIKYNKGSSKRFITTIIKNQKYYFNESTYIEYKPVDKNLNTIKKIEKIHGKNYGQAIKYLKLTKKTKNHTIKIYIHIAKKAEKSTTINVEIIDKKSDKKYEYEINSKGILSTIHSTKGSKHKTVTHPKAITPAPIDIAMVMYNIAKADGNHQKLCEIRKTVNNWNIKALATQDVTKNFRNAYAYNMSISSTIQPPDFYGDKHLWVFYRWVIDESCYKYSLNLCVDVDTQKIRYINMVQRTLDLDKEDNVTILRTTDIHHNYISTSLSDFTIDP